MTGRETMSSFKLGLSILWPACWTALPIKMAFALLFMAMGSIHIETTLGVTFLMLLISPVSVIAFFVISFGMDFHFAEGTGLPLLFLIAIPIDMWALGLVARTVFLERLRLEPPASLGVSLWARFAVAGALYLPMLWLVEGWVTDLARSIVKSILDVEALKHLPVAERIGVEFTAWSSVSLVVLLALTYLGLSLLGKLVQGRAAAAQPARDSYQGLISRWDMIRVPADQSLMLTSFTAAGAILSILFWAALPTSTPHPHECCKPPDEKTSTHFDAQKALAKGEKIFKDAELKIAALEQKAADEEKNQPKGGKDKEKAGVKEGSARSEGKASQPAAGKSAGSGK
ncbi:MAG: rane protein of unknown function [Nitrospira sp.]|jgi:hypothetical protein|nr:rane protein of unknown function [Nitrospira sp.]